MSGSDSGIQCRRDLWLSLIHISTQYDKNAKITARTLKEEVRRYDIPELMDRVKGVDELYSKEQLTTMQVNVGYRCNLSCAHCFLECGPDKTEMMSKETMDQCLQAFKTGGFLSLIHIS